MKNKNTALAVLPIALLCSGTLETADACTRAVYLGPDQTVITGRTMDWKEDIMTNIFVFPRGINRSGYNKGETVHWTSKYGSVVATGYDMGTCDGMNEKGLTASLLFLPESNYTQPNDTRPVMGISIWTQYVLDNFATVDEAVAELKKETFRIDAPRMPNGSESTLHMAITDNTGNTAVLEYLDGKLNIHKGKEYQVLTNSPRYDYQLAINDYWQEIGGLNQLPGTNRSSDRFVRAYFYIHAIPQTSDPKIAVPSVLSVMRNVSVPFGITTPDKPHISSTRWRSISDQKNKVYYFESVLNSNLFWLNLKEIDFSPNAEIKKLSLTNGEYYAGNAVKELNTSKPFTFLFQTPSM
ncbi:MAG: linear amide C-N hydrolase [Bacteroidaceae bacterium]|nr:linear amide C-N hydrolase [Bacteroidaceae bacterium]